MGIFSLKGKTYMFAKGSWAHPASYSSVTVDSLLVVKCDADHSSPNNGKLRMT